jgi:hypothetical protein
MHVRLYLQVVVFQLVNLMFSIFAVVLAHININNAQMFLFLNMEITILMS